MTTRSAGLVCRTGQSGRLAEESETLEALVGVACRAAVPIAEPASGQECDDGDNEPRSHEPYVIHWQTATEHRSGCVRPDQDHRRSRLAQELLGDIPDLPPPRRALAVRGDDQQIAAPQGSHDFDRGRPGANLGRGRHVERLKGCRRASEIGVRRLVTGCGMVARAVSGITLCSRTDLVAHAHEMEWHSQLPGEKRRQRQRALGRWRAIERGHDSPNWLGGHRMVATAKKQRRGGSVSGDPVGDTAKQQATATPGALSRHDDQIGVGRVADDTFRGTSVSDSSLDRALRRTEPRRNLLEISGRRLSCPDAPRGRREASRTRWAGRAYAQLSAASARSEPSSGTRMQSSPVTAPCLPLPEDVRRRMTGTRDSRSSFSATLPSTQRELL